MNYYYAKDKDSKKNLWLLVDLATGKNVVVSGDEVKSKMRSKNVDIVNLKLTSDNRLISATEDTIKSMMNFVNAPEDVKKVAEPIKDIKYVDFINSKVDRMMKAAVKSIEGSMTVGLRNNKTLMDVMNVDPENNIIGLRFKHGVDTIIILRYEVVVYGMKNDLSQTSMHSSRECKYKEIYYDVLIQILGVKRGKEVYKTDKEIISVAKKDLVTYEIQHLELDDGSLSAIKAIDRGDYLALMFEEKDGKILEETNAESNMTFARYTIMTSISMALIDSGVKASKVNNIDLKELQYNENLKSTILIDRIFGAALPIGTTAATALMFAGIFGLAVMLPDNIIKAHILSRIIGYNGFIDMIVSSGLVPLGATVGGVVGTAVGAASNAGTVKNIHNNVKDSKQKLKESNERLNDDKYGDTNLLCKVFASNVDDKKKK